MFGPSSIYGLDIETDNSDGHGLNPAKSRITEITVVGADRGEVFNDTDEIALLVAVDEYLRTLPPGLLATWNGSFFDMPFIADRRQLAAPFLDGGPLLTADPELKPKYEPLPGHAGGYSAVWPIGDGRVHQHLDISQAYKQVADDLGVKWSLKPVCTALGIEMVELDRENLHLYTPAERAAYNLSDGHGTRQLALRTLGLA